MVTYNKFEQFQGDVYNGVIDHSVDEFKIGLTAGTPLVTDTDLNTTTTPDQFVPSAVAEIAAGNGYTEGGNVLTITTAAEASGTYTFAANQTVFTASGGAITAFQRYYLYVNDAGAAATRPVVSFWDHGSSVTLNDGDTFTIQFSGTDPGNIFTSV